MEAWILHVRDEYQDEAHRLSHHDVYSAWMSEKQAYKAAGKFLLEKSELDWTGPFIDHQALRHAIRALVKCDKVKEAIDLVNRHSESTDFKPGKGASHKIHIKITKSTFLGSPFE